MAGLQALPSISWLPLAIIWFGLTERAILFVVIIAAIPAVAIGAASSIRLVPPLLIRAGRTLGCARWIAASARRAPGCDPRLRRRPPGGVGAVLASADGRRAHLDGRQGPRASARREPAALLWSANIFAVMLMIIIVGMVGRGVVRRSSTAGSAADAGCWRRRNARASYGTGAAKCSPRPRSPFNAIRSSENRGSSAPAARSP